MLFEVYGSNFNLPESNQIFQISFNRSLYQQIQSQESSNSNLLEPVLRSLIIQLHISQISNDIIDTLKSALSFHEGVSHLDLELQLINFINLKEQDNKSNDNEYYISLLYESFENRKESRTQLLFNSCTKDIFKTQIYQCNQTIQFLEDKRQETFFEL
jgi:hypothetical protein